MGVSHAALNTAFNAQDPIYSYGEMYIPVAIKGSGWLSMGDVHVTGTSSRLDTNPGFMFIDNEADGDCTSGYLPGDNEVAFHFIRITGEEEINPCTPNGWLSWTNLDGVGASTSSPLPVGEWFELEYMYQRSDGTACINGTDCDGTMQLWVNNVLAIDAQNVQTWWSGRENFEVYPSKLYGAPTFTDWTAGDTRFYMRNQTVGTCAIPSPYSTACYSDGDPGDTSAPITEGTGGSGGVAGAGGTAGTGGVAGAGGTAGTGGVGGTGGTGGVGGAVDMDFYATRTSCKRPCAIQFDAQKTEALSWATVRDSRFVWDFDNPDDADNTEGFLAATVYETAGTYNPTLTVDGQQWNAGTITVSDPTQINCVSLVSNWTGCPGGAGQYTSVSGGLAATTTGEMLLFHSGESYGDQGLGGKSDVAMGAYGDAGEGDTSAGQPLFAIGGTWAGADAQSWSDLEMSSTGNAMSSSLSSSDVLLLRMTVSSSGGRILYGEGEFFIVNSALTGYDYTIYVQGNNKPTAYAVVKNTKLDRTTSGQHTSRIEEGHRVLYQGSSFTGPGNQTSSRMGRGTEWVLFQGNYMNQCTTFGEPGYTNQYFMVEGNLYDVDNDPSGTHCGMSITASSDNVMRNNMCRNARGGFCLDSGGGQTLFYNNTVYATTDLNFGLNAGGTGSAAYNNLVYSTTTMGGGCSADNNWCNTSSFCRDPVDGDTDCHAPSFVSTANPGDTSWDPVAGDSPSWPQSTDYLRPGVGTRGIGAGDEAVPVWIDYYGASRADIDVGAVER